MKKGVLCVALVALLSTASVFAFDFSGIGFQSGSVSGSGITFKTDVLTYNIGYWGPGATSLALSVEKWFIDAPITDFSTSNKFVLGWFAGGGAGVGLFGTYMVGLGAFANIGLTFNMYDVLLERLEFFGGYRISLDVGLLPTNKYFDPVYFGFGFFGWTSGLRFYF